MIEIFSHIFLQYQIYIGTIKNTRIRNEKYDSPSLFRKLIKLVGFSQLLTRLNLLWRQL